MCDTIVALGAATKDGDTLFGKNSDREPDEVQNLEIIERKTHGSNDKVKCIYLEIPQVQETTVHFYVDHFGCSERKLVSMNMELL